MGGFSLHNNYKKGHLKKTKRIHFNTGQMRCVATFIALRVLWKIKQPAVCYSQAVVLVLMKENSST